MDLSLFSGTVYFKILGVKHYRNYVTPLSRYWTDPKVKGGRVHVFLIRVEGLNHVTAPYKMIDLTNFKNE